MDITVKSQQKPIIAAIKGPVANANPAKATPPTSSAPTGSVSDNPDAAKKVAENNEIMKKALVAHVIASGVGTLGAVAGIVYNVKTGGGFWRGVGFFFLGGIIFGLPAHIAANVYVAKSILKK